MAFSTSTLSTSPAFTELRFQEIYKFRKTSCQLKVIRSNEYNKVYLGFHKYLSYLDPTTSEKKKIHNFVNYPLVAIDELIKCLANVREFAKNQSGVNKLHKYICSVICMHLVYTGLNGDAIDGRLGDFVHATISTVSNTTDAVLGKLRQCGLSAEGGGQVGPTQCQSAGDGFAELAGSVASFPKSVRFTLHQRSDKWLLVEFTTEQLSPGKRKLSAAFATDVETEQEVELAPTKIKRAYNGKAKANIVKEKAAADGTIDWAKVAKQTISNIIGKFIKQIAERVGTDTSSGGGECPANDK